MNTANDLDTATTHREHKTFATLVVIDRPGYRDLGRPAPVLVELKEAGLLIETRMGMPAGWATLTCAAPRPDHSARSWYYDHPQRTCAAHQGPAAH